MSIRVGMGFDVHRFAPPSDDRPLILGGVRFSDTGGLAGHSDADVVAHAVADAVLGAAGQGDIGQHFPFGDPKWAGADSIELLRAAVSIVAAAGAAIGNVDATVVCERPRIAPHRSRMEDVMSAAVGAPVSVKASTAEGLGAIGRVEGVASWAVAVAEMA